MPSSRSHIVEQTLSELCCCLGQATGSGLGWEIWRNGLWPFHKYKGTFFVSRRAVICSTGFLIAARFKKSAEFGCCLCPHLAPLTHFRGVLTFQDTCLASVRLPICSQLTQPPHFYEATLFRMASCPPKLYHILHALSWHSLASKRLPKSHPPHQRALLTPDPWLVCVDKVAPHTQRRAH